MTRSKLCVTRTALDAMLHYFRDHLPREGCGFLAGRGNVAFRFYPIHNINPELSRFLMDPRHVMRTEKSIHRRDQRILGVCHSHPTGECHPSRRDISGAFFDSGFETPLWVSEVQVIALMDPPEAPEVRGFHILPGGCVVEVELEIANPPVAVGEISTCT